MHYKRLLTSLMIAAVLVVGAGAAFAQDITPDQPGIGLHDDFGGRGGRGGFGGHGGRDGGRGGVIREALTSAAGETGLTEAEILTELQDGATLNDIVTTNGGDPQVVIDAAVAAATERINTAVADGRITQERADAKLATLVADVTSAMNGTLMPGRFGGRLGDHVRHGVIGLVAEQTGLSRVEIRAALQDGQTLAEVLAANGADMDAFVAEAVERTEARLNVQVAIDRITQEQADDLLGQFQSQLEERLNTSGSLELETPSV